MKIHKMKDFTGGWFIGNFDPNVYRSKDVEVCYKVHHAGEVWPSHYHRGIEINYLIRGEMTVQDALLIEGDIFVIEAYEVADPIFLTDCELIVVKFPSDPEDKHIV